MKDQLNKLLNFIKFKKSSSMKNKNLGEIIQSTTDLDDETLSQISYKVSPIQCKIPMTSGLAELLKKSPKAKNSSPKSENSLFRLDETETKRNIKPEPTGISKRLSLTRKSKKVSWIYEP